MFTANPSVTRESFGVFSSVKKIGLLYFSFTLFGLWAQTESSLLTVKQYDVDINPYDYFQGWSSKWYEFEYHFFNPTT